MVVDVAIDQGGCFETRGRRRMPSRSTSSTASSTTASPTCRAACRARRLYALNNATLPFVLALADRGWRKALSDDPHLRNGLNVAHGKVTCKPVADVQGYKFVDPREAIT